ncbi:Zinc iron permease [Pyrenophora seminiperda CCB06]|uniref:Zinc iron permease n=1 Tax=Pyrenophora seminiperda CCB06 TaxID=1302712 RepID=A0A3M7LWF3_9PLEO|nr:Zinc iron permease [Pyrenophora seminiperda CCB06]
MALSSVQSSSHAADYIPFADLTTLPAHILRAELLRRQQDDEQRPKCETKGGKGDYNTLTHVLALGLILVLSTAGSWLPPMVPSLPR